MQKILEIIHNLSPIETNSLILRKLRIEDAEDAFVFLSDLESTQYTRYNTINSIESSKKFIEKLVADCYHGEKIMWGIIHKTEQKLIGIAGFVKYYITDSRAEFSYLSSKLYWNRGYATEVTQEIINFGFNIMSLHRIEATCIPENTFSIKVLERVGMTFDGVLREYTLKNGVFETHLLYSILQQRWAKKNIINLYLSCPSISPYIRGCYYNLKVFTIKCISIFISCVFFISNLLLSLS